MTATDIIAWTANGAAYCPEHKPEPDATGYMPGAYRVGKSTYANDPAAPVFASDAASFEDGGLSCDTCGTVIVENDTCGTCSRSLRDAHDGYTYGPAGHVTTVTLCRPHRLATVLVREMVADHREMVAGTVTTYTQEVPYEEPIIDGMRPVEEDGAGALDSILAAFSGMIATFDIVSTEEVTA